MRGKFKVLALRCKGQNISPGFKTGSWVIVINFPRIEETDQNKLFDAQTCVSEPNSLGLSTTDVYVQLPGGLLLCGSADGLLLWR